MKKKYTYSKQKIVKSDIYKVTDTLKKYNISKGPIVNAFEKKLTKITKSKYAIAVNSGTSALIAAIQSLNLKKESYVAVPNITFVASASSVVLSGYKVKLIDVDKDTGLFKINSLKQLINKYKISCLVNVHLNGNIDNLKKIYSICKKNNIKIIEDACHAFGTTYKIGNTKYNVGDNSFCDVSTLSFHPAKLITTGEGGALLTNDKRIKDNATMLINHGYESQKIRKGKYYLNYYKINKPGYNFRISDLNCALGLSQLSRFKKKLSHRRRVAKFYDGYFNNTDLVSVLKIKNNIKSAYHLYPIFINDFKSINKYQLIENLKKKNITTQIHYLPLNRQPLFKNKNFYDSDIYFEKVLSIPLHDEINFDDAKLIANTILNEIKKIKKK